MRRATAGAAAVLAALWAGGCTLAEVSQPESEEVVAVEAVLRTDRPVQYVVVHRALNGLFVGGAPGSAVTLERAGGGRMRLIEEARSVCYGYSSRYFPDNPDAVQASCFRTPISGQPEEAEYGPAVQVLPGETWELHVRTPEGKLLRGRTTVPGLATDPEAPGPPGGFRLLGLPFDAFQQPPGLEAWCDLPAGTRLPVRWTQAPGAWAYVAPAHIDGLRAALERRGIPGAPDPLELDGIAVGQADVELVLPTEFGVFERFQYDSEVLAALQDGFPAGVTVRLAVAAADRNYVNGVRGGRFNPSGPVRVSSVVGDGVGVFGSLVPLSLRIEVREPELVRKPCGTS